MASPPNKPPKFTAKCPPRKPVEFISNEDVAKEIAENSKIIPLFEKGLFEYAHKRHYSLLRNENLACEWAKYKKQIESRVIAPFQFPDQRDLHFYKHMIRFAPSETEHKRPCFRKSLKVGPGVDYGGQMPIPQELIMKRHIAVKENSKEEAKKRSNVKSAKMKKTNVAKSKNKPKEATLTDKENKKTE